MLTNRFYPKQDIEKVLEVKHNKIYSKDDFYKPIMLSINGSNYCNLSCYACSMSSMNSKTNAIQMPVDVICNIIEQAIDNGFLVYTLTVPAEPFLDLSILETTIKKYGDKIDENKINTNCSLFTDYKKAEELIHRLKLIGWHKTQYFKPALTLSVGMQQKYVPLENIVYGILAFNNVFSKNEATLTISHYHDNKDYKNEIDKLAIIYKEITKRELIEDVIFKSNELLFAGRAQKADSERFKIYSLKDKVKEQKCFELIISEYIEPGLYIYENGDVSICPGFIREENKIWGNAYTDKISQIIKKANNNDFFRIINSYGTFEIFNIIKKQIPDIENLKVTNRHEACQLMFNLVKGNAKLREYFNFK